MARTHSSTRQRLINAALELFSSQGVTETTTRQIAELAQVNEVTLFRQFGNKQGLLLAVIEDSAVFTHLGEALREQIHHTTHVAQALKSYARDRLQVLETIPELLRSVVGEAGQFTLENRRALGRGVTLANQEVAQYLAAVIEREQLQLRISPENLSSLLNGMLFGYLVIEITSEFHELWSDREDFLESLVQLCLYGAVLPAPEASNNNISLRDFPQPPFKSRAIEEIADLPAVLVHEILQQAKKQSLRNYALAYTLFATGLRPQEVVSLERDSYRAASLTHQIKDEQYLLQVNQGAVRQVPINQWIMGKRYGSYKRNPLTQWLKSRKDDKSALFINDSGEPFSETELYAAWQEFTAELLTPEGQSPSLSQARQTWCVEMLMKGIDLEDLSVLSGWDTTQLQPYAQRAKEKAALERAFKLDRKA
jgi:AcrR family transcriptional regulator